MVAKGGFVALLQSLSFNRSVKGLNIDDKHPRVLPWAILYKSFGLVLYQCVEGF
jgi:hypothetical protein